MNQNTPPLITAEGVRVTFDGREILAGIDLRVHAGEIVTLIGPNGAGKSSLVRAVLGLLRPDAGTIRLRQGLRIGYMPQRLMIDVNLPLSVRRFLTLTSKIRPEQSQEVLRELGIAQLLDQPMQSLSGGETQRVLLAKALLRRPELLVLDEPVQGVDVAGQGELYRLIGRFRDRLGCGVLMVSHDLHLVMAATDTVLCLNRHLCCSGHPETISHHPAYLALFGATAAAQLAVYTHQHDHRHDMHGNVIPPAEGNGHG
ncbi:MAG: zinc ABC transporter ATP-binding protein ZnuC [Gammaproteobacteria bacterium]|nr:zinc ABC transporter ATP-binding protein ZnuC [Gammaproteobacteria bacterium]MBU1654970.1 zinc ABC transporter ATP-binding protein ZnuC [Gammaproteobacteria bacterium]MBU1960064.1 zinc ABC transporter ATP-binding protein ZnuC [Gammaproteobacteria bacterium]